MKVDKRLMNAYRTRKKDVEDILFTARHQSTLHRTSIKNEIRNFSTPLSQGYEKPLSRIFFGSLATSAIYYFNFKQSAYFSDSDNLAGTPAGDLIGITAGVSLLSLTALSLLSWTDKFRYKFASPYTHSTEYQIARKDAHNNAETDVSKV